MSVQSEIARIAGNVADAYAAVSQKGGTLPENQVSGNLAEAIRSIPAGGGIHLASIAVTTPPNKILYKPGESFDPEGMAVTAAYSNGAAMAAAGWTYFPSGPLPEGTESVTILYSEGGVTVQTTQAVSVGEMEIYGASWDGTSTTRWTRTDNAAGFADPVPYVAGASGCGSPFDHLYPWSGMVISEREGGTMVAIPKFWYKLTQNGAGLSVQIANQAAEGFAVSPAHMDRGDGEGERDLVYIGRYHCGSEFKSVTGQIPKTSLSRADFRVSIHALGSNIWQSDFAMRFTIWLLYIVEYADWNSQSAIGNGCGDDSAVGNMGYTDSMPYHTGTTQNSRGVYGLGTQYRNIEGLWDNCYDLTDGCYNSAAGLNIILNPNEFSDNSGGTPAGVPASGYSSAFTVTEAGGFQMFIPSESNGGSAAASCDGWYFDRAIPVIYAGGSYDQGGSRGLFYVNCIYAGDANSRRGSRIQELPGEEV